MTDEYFEELHVDPGISKSRSCYMYLIGLVQCRRLLHMGRACFPDVKKNIKLFP